MNKFLIFTLAIFPVFTTAQTKRTTKLTLGAELAIPATNQAFNVYKAGYGGTFKLLHPTGKKSYFTATVGVINFSGRTVNFADYGLAFPGLVLTNYNVSHSPLTTYAIKVGYRYVFTKQQKMFAEAETGYTIGEVLGFGQEVKTGDVSGVTFAIGFGKRIANKFEISARYERFETPISNTGFTAFGSIRTMLNLEWMKKH